MSSEFGYATDPLRLAIISYITSNPNSTLEDIFRGIPASHTKVRHWLQELSRSGTIIPSSPIGSIPLQFITWSTVVLSNTDLEVLVSAVPTQLEVLVGAANTDLEVLT
jgi:DNA-binding IclR family transcriptional regulator